jgi:hypothetical protein
METPEQRQCDALLTASPRDVQMKADLQDLGVLRGHFGGDARGVFLNLSQERLLGGIMLVQQHLNFLEDPGVIRVGLDSGQQSAQFELKGAMLKQQQIS